MSRLSEAEAEGQQDGDGEPGDQPGHRTWQAFRKT